MTRSGLVDRSPEFLGDLAARRHPRVDGPVGPAMPLVLTKLAPPRLAASMVRRPRLEALLTRRTDSPVTLVRAGPGSGKSLAVASWLAADWADGAAAWLTLDQTDNDVATFWVDVLAALRASGALPADSPLHDLVPARRFNAPEIRRVQAGLEGLARPLVLVLDDLHQVSNREVLDGLSRLVERPLPTLRLVLITQAAPPPRLQRLRVSGHLGEIGPSDLAFDAAEAGELFTRSGLPLTPPRLRVLLERTEGWAAGLRLAAMSLDPDDLDASIAEFSGDQRTVVEYLVAEVLDRNPPSVRRFLLHTSATDRISGALADALTGHADGGRILERLANDGALVVGIGHHREWFRYHPLLRQMLLNQLRVDDPAVIPELHRRAATWFADHDAPIDAVRHAALSGDEELLGHTLLNHALPWLMSPEGRRLVAAIQTAETDPAGRPTLVGLVCAATVHLNRHDYPAMGLDIRRARELLGTVRPGLRATADIALTLFETAGARGRGLAAQTVAFGKRALHLLDRAPADLAVTPQYRVLALSNLGVGHLWDCRFGEAAGCLHAAEEEAHRLRLELTYLNVQAHLALIDVANGSLDLGYDRAAAAIRIAERRAWTSEPEIIAAHLACASVHMQRAELRAAARHIARGMAAGGGHSGHAARAAVQILQARLLLAKGHVTKALATTAAVREQADTSGTTAPLLDSWIAAATANARLLAGDPEAAIDCLETDGDANLGARGRVFLGDGRVALARAKLHLGQPRAAETLLRRVVGDGDTDLATATEAWLGLVQVAEQRRLDSAAAEALARAIELAEPQRVRLPFLVLGDRLAVLVRQQQELVRGGSEFAADLAARLGLDTGAPVTPLAEPLTDRELSVLRYLPTMRSNSEIGCDLYVSVNTVKAHLKALYRKLGVANRREAVRRARDLGLISESSGFRPSPP
jgi:LuxR family maltose regulon positive regulatory protein